MNTVRLNKIDRDSTRNIDMHGRRTVNASPSIDLNDYVIKKELMDAVAGFSSQIFSTTAILTQGTHAQRPSIVKNNQLYYETDRTVLYIGVSGTWKYSAGICSATQATLPADLTVNDDGFLCYVTDFNHLLRWSGSGLAWNWGPGDNGSDYFTIRGSTTTETGWHACDGSTGISFLKKDGSTGTRDLPNSASTDSYIKVGSSYSKTINSATVPTSSALTFTGSALGTHSHTLPISYLGGSFGLNTSQAISHSFGYTVVVTTTTTSGTATTAITDDAVSAGTPSGTINTPTISLPGDPVANFKTILYFRQ